MWLTRHQSLQVWELRWQPPTAPGMCATKAAMRLPKRLSSASELAFPLSSNKHTNPAVRNNFIQRTTLRGSLPTAALQYQPHPDLSGGSKCSRVASSRPCLHPKHPGSSPQWPVSFSHAMTKLSLPWSCATTATGSDTCNRASECERHLLKAGHCQVSKHVQEARRGRPQNQGTRNDNISDVALAPCKT